MHINALLPLWIHLASGISAVYSVLERSRHQVAAHCQSHLTRFAYSSNEYRKGINSCVKPGFIYEGQRIEHVLGKAGIPSHRMPYATWRNNNALCCNARRHSTLADDAGYDYPADALDVDSASIGTAEQSTTVDSHNDSTIGNDAADDGALASSLSDASDPDNVWYERELIDMCKIKAVGGRGGNGCVSFRREKHVPLGGADGGNGGPGGSVYLICDETMSNLNPVKQLYVYKAENGKHGCGERQNGAKGRHRYIRVPSGTHVYSVEGVLHAVLQNNGDRIMVVRGGRGGKGNRYYKSKFNVAPKICEMGEEGITREVILNYKLVGNVALVGKPNSGKSSILRCLSNARPRVAGFAFSTKFPIVGVMDVKKEWKDTEENDNTYDASSEDGEEIPDFYSSTEEETYSSEDTNSSIPTDSDLSEYDMESSHSDRNVWSSDDPSELVDDFDEYSSSDESYNAAIYNSDDDEDDGVKFLCGYGYRAAPQLRSLSTGPSGTKGWTDHVPNSTSTKVEDTDNMMPNIQVKRVTTEGVAIDNLKHIPEGTNEASLTEYDTDEDGLNESDDTSRTFGTADDLEDLCGIGSTSEEEPKRQLVIADVPGLIEGASQGRGLGHKFLKHIENCNVLAYVIDASVDNPLNDYMDVRNEIGLFNESLLSRLSLILLNKLDLIDAERAAELVEMFKSECQHDRVYTVSAKTRGNIETVKVAFSHIYKDPIKKPPNKTNTLDISIDPQDDFRRINPRKFKVEKIEEGEFRIKSSYLERKVPMMRFDQRETLDKLRRILRINRIHYKLKRMGVKAGDVIHIGQMSFCVNELAY